MNCDSISWILMTKLNDFAKQLQNLDEQKIYYMYRIAGIFSYNRYYDK